MNRLDEKLHFLRHGQVVSSALKTLTNAGLPIHQTRRSVDHFVMAHQLLQKGDHLGALSLNLNAWTLEAPAVFSLPKGPQVTGEFTHDSQSKNRVFHEAVIMLGQILWFWRSVLPPKLSDSHNEVWYLACDLFFEMSQHFDISNVQNENIQKQLIGLSDGLDPRYWRTLGTKGIRLRRMGLDDQDDLLALLQEPHFIDLYLPSLKANRDFVQQWCGVAQSVRSPMKRIEFGVVDSENDKILGLASLGNIDSKSQSAEFLVGISMGSRQAGLAAVGLQASVMLMNWAFKDLNLRKLISFVYHKNLHAQNGTLKLGFVQEELLSNQVKNLQTGEKTSVFKNGLTRDQFDKNHQLQRWVQRFCK